MNKAKDAYDPVVKGEKPPEEVKKPVKIEIEKKGKEQDDLLLELRAKFG